MQIALLVLDLSVKDRFTISFKSAYIVIIGVYLFFLYKYPTFNYKRIKIFIFTSAGVVLINSILTTTFYIVFG